MKNRFARGLHSSGTYTCGVCKKLTRDTGRDEAGVGLCARCLYEAYVENSESDYGKGSVEHRAAIEALAELTA